MSLSTPTSDRRTSPDGSPAHGCAEHGSLEAGQASGLYSGAPERVNAAIIAPYTASIASGSLGTIVK